MNHKRFKKKWMVPIGLAAAVLLMILIGSTTSVQAQTGMPSTIPNPGVPIDEEMKFSLDGQDYAIDTELPNDQDPKLHKQGDQICVVWPNGSTGECIKSGQENFIVEPISNIGNGTGTIWTTQGNCRWLYQLWVHGTPIQVNLLKVDDQNGESASWCDGTVKLIEKGESDDHNGQIVEVTDDGKVLIDGIEKVTSGVSTCAVLIEAKSGAMHRIERYTPLSPGSRQGLLHPSVLLLGKDAGWEDLNRGSGVGLYKQLADQVCPPEVPPPPAGPSSLFLPLICTEDDGPCADFEVHTQDVTHNYLEDGRIGCADNVDLKVMWSNPTNAWVQVTVLQTGEMIFRDPNTATRGFVVIEDLDLKEKGLCGSDLVFVVQEAGDACNNSATRHVDPVDSDGDGVPDHEDEFPLDPIRH